MSLLLIFLSLPTLIIGGTIGSPNLIVASFAMYVMGMALGIGGLFVREVLGLGRNTNAVDMFDRKMDK